MAYKYEPDTTELLAADLLREKGWRVSEPPCPDCKGSGRIWHFEWAKPGEPMNDPSTYERCPRGCEVPRWF